MSLPEVFPRDPLALIQFLRAGEFRLGTGDVLRTVELLERLAEQGRAPTSPEDAARWLAPVLCISPRQQQILLPRLRAYQSFEVVEPPARKSGTDYSIVPEAAPPARIPYWVRVGVAVALVAFAALLILRLTPANVWTAPNFVPVQAARAVTSASGPLYPPTVLRGFWQVLPLGLVPPLTWLLWVRLRRLGRPVLTRRPYDGRAAATLHPGTKRLALFAGADLVRGAQGMRAHRRVASLRVDARASARATARAAGRPVLLTGSRPRLPDYPIIVDQLGARDHLPALARALARRLSEEGVPNALLLCGDDFRWLRDDASAWSPTTLADLTARHDADVLLIVGDGAGLLDPLSGRLETTLSALEQWRVVVLLTPVPRRRWSWRERHLALAGVLVLPATPEGVGLLGDFLRSESKRPRLALERAPVRPGLLVREGRDAFRWHRDDLPGDADREATLDAIALELSPAGFELACVLALFPELRPDLTLHAAAMPYATDAAAAHPPAAGPRPLADEATFAALAVLPWFRYGRIPNWLRLDLVRSLRPERTEQARAMYAAWLSSSRTGESSVEVTADSLGRVVSDAAANSPGSPLRDAIFLRFARGEDPAEIELDAPEAVVDAVQAEVRRWEWRGKVAAFVVSGLIFAAGAVAAVVGFMPALVTNGSTLFRLLVAGFLLCFSFGPVIGVVHTIRGRSGIADRYGIVPLVSALIGLLLASAPWLSVPPLASESWIILSTLPCLSMALVPGERISAHRFLLPIIRGAREAVTLPSILLAAAGLVVVLDAVAGSAVGVDAMSLECAVGLGLHAVGVATLFARRTNLPMLGLASQATIASWIGFQLVVPVSYTAEQLFNLDTSVSRIATAGTLALIGLASPYLACALAMNVRHGVALGASLLLWLISATVPVLLTVLLPEIQLLLIFLPILPAAALVLTTAAIRPLDLRQWQTWMVVAVASLAGIVVDLAGVFATAANPHAWYEPIVAIMDSTRNTNEFAFIDFSPAWFAGFAILPAAFAWMAAARGGASIRDRTRASLRAYWPAPATRWTAILWGAALCPLLGPQGIDLSPVYLPLAVAASVQLGPPAMAVLLWGGLPLLAGVSGIPGLLDPAHAAVVTSPSPDLFVTSVILHWLITETRKRNAVSFLREIDVIQTFALICLGALSIRVAVSDHITLGGDLALPTGLTLALAGAMGARWSRVMPAIAVAGLLGVGAFFVPRAVGNGPVGIEFQVNVLTLLLLYLLGWLWMRKFVADTATMQIRVGILRILSWQSTVRTGPNLIQSWIFVTALILVGSNFAATVFTPLHQPGNLAAPFAAAVAIGSLSTGGRLAAILAAATIFALCVAGVELSSIWFSGLGRNLFGPYELHPNPALVDAILAFSGTLIGWRLGYWARGNGAEWLRRQMPAGSGNTEWKYIPSQEEPVATA